MTTPRTPYQKDGNWWYERTNPITGERRPYGPFYSLEDAHKDMESKETGR